MRRSALSLLPSLRAGLLQQQQAAAVLGARLGAQQLRFFADDANLKKTTLYDFHVAHGGAPIGRRSVGAGHRKKAPRALWRALWRCVRCAASITHTARRIVH